MNYVIDAKLTHKVVWCSICLILAFGGRGCNCDFQVFNAPQAPSVLNCAGAELASILLSLIVFPFLSLSNASSFPLSFTFRPFSNRFSLFPFSHTVPSSSSFLVSLYPYLNQGFRYNPREDFFQTQTHFIALFAPNQRIDIPGFQCVKGQLIATRHNPAKSTPVSALFGQQSI